MEGQKLDKLKSLGVPQEIAKPGYCFTGDVTVMLPEGLELSLWFCALCIGGSSCNSPTKIESCYPRCAQLLPRDPSGS